MNMPGKTKDNLKICLELEEMGIRKDLHLKNKWGTNVKF